MLFREPQLVFSTVTLYSQALGFCQAPGRQFIVGSSQLCYFASKLLVEYVQLLLSPLALRDVADGSHHKVTGVGLERTQADLDGEFTGVITQPEQLQPYSHGP